MKEIWKDIKDYEGLYQISNTGKVKSIKNNNRYRGRILSGYNRAGYRVVCLVKNKIQKVYYIHRLVAINFIPNPNNYPIINHKNGNKQNNRVDNLEWCDNSHNVKEAFRLGLKKPTWLGKTGIQCPISKKVNQYDKQGNFIKTWNSMMDVQRELGIFAISISRCCRGIVKTAGKYKWKYKIEKLESKDE